MTFGTSLEKDICSHDLRILRKKIRDLVKNEDTPYFKRGSIYTGDVAMMKVLGFVDMVVNPNTFQPEAICLYEGAEPRLAKEVLKLFARYDQARNIWNELTR